MSKVKENTREELVKTILNNSRLELKGNKNNIDTMLESTNDFLNTLSIDELQVMADAI